MKNLIRVIVAVLALSAVVSNAQNIGPDKPDPYGRVKLDESATASKPIFETGAFLTADDFEYVADCLDRVALSAADLGYEKKLLKQRFVLKACEKALDEPLTVPRTTEVAAQKFSLKSSTVDHARHAADLLDLPP